MEAHTRRRAARCFVRIAPRVLLAAVAALAAAYGVPSAMAGPVAGTVVQLSGAMVAQKPDGTLKPLAQATGGDARRVVDGSSVELPRIVPVRSANVFRGDGWMGVRMRDASVVKGVGVLPMFAGIVGLLLLLGAFAATWMREGR